MKTIHYSGHSAQCKPEETLLECLLRHGLPIQFSCKSGVCHRCMVKATSGEIPEAASKKLPETHQGQNYLLACQCRPSTDMHIVAKSDEDTITKCMTLELRETDGLSSTLDCEAYREFAYQTGCHVVLSDLNRTHSIIGTLSSDPEMGTTLSIDILHNDLAWLTQSGLDTIGQEFYIRGPLPTTQSEPERIPPQPTLWEALGGDRTVRAFLTTFYTKVYADTQLAPFFERVTMDRIIGKQFAFLKQNITGEEVYFGELPRNTHHWMVISEELLEHRMQLMHEALHEHHIPQELINELVKYELQFKSDIVKTQPWLKQIGDLLVDTEKYEECELDEATVCDYCGGEIQKHTVVRFHSRLGKVACQNCSIQTNSP